MIESNTLIDAPWRSRGARRLKSAGCRAKVAVANHLACLNDVCGKEAATTEFPINSEVLH